MEHVKLLAERGRRVTEELPTHDWLARQKSRMGIAASAPPQRGRNPLAEEEAIEMDETRAD